MNFNITNFLKFLLLLVVCFFSCLAASKYRGSANLYLLYSFLLNTLLYFGIRKKALFFDLFIGGLFWLGFWLKLSLRIIIENGDFSGEVGFFDHTPSSYDKVLLIVSCGVLALLVASITREKFFFSYNKKGYAEGLDGLFLLYKKYRNLLWIIFSILFIGCAITNMYFGIYQRGTVPRTVLPYRLSGIYTWFLLFGASSITAIFLQFECLMPKKKMLRVVFLGALEGLCSNGSMLSRGMILNMTALGIGLKKNIIQKSLRTGGPFYITASFICIFLFGISLYFVNHIRKETFTYTNDPIIKMRRAEERQKSHEKLNLVEEDGRISTSILKHAGNMNHSTKMLFIDRWVGIEGVMAVSSYPEKGWKLWKKAWKEKYLNYGTSFFDKYITVSSYTTYGRYLLKEHHFISLPGILAFMYYPGSYLFLFFTMFLVGVTGAGIEFCVYKLSQGNLILCSLISQVVAYRFAHFGYVPARSYLLFGSIFLTLFLIYFFNKLLTSFFKLKCSDAT